MKVIQKKGQEKGTLVFIHGNSSSADIFREVMAEAEIGHSKIAVDLPGHGTNTEDDFQPEDFLTRTIGDQLVALLNQIDDDIVLGGNSFGGHLAIEIADRVKRLKGLLIFGTPPLKKPVNFEEAFLPVPELQTFLTENPTTAEIEAAAVVAVFDKNLASRIVEDFKKASPAVRTSLVSDITTGKWNDQEAIFVNLGLKKYIIRGKQDPSVNPQYLEEVSQKCQGNCEIIVFEECGHYPSMEKPQAFIHTIKRIATEVF